MMASLFLIFAVIIILIIAGFRKWAIYLTIINLALCTIMFLYHITETLKINW